MAKISVFKWLREHEGAVILASAAVILLCIEFFASSLYFLARFPLASREHGGLYPHLWWAVWTCVLFFVIPLAMVKLVFARSLRDFGLTWRISRRHWLLYAAMLLLMMPVVMVAAAQPDFLATYPFYRGALDGQAWQILVWELAYLSTFFALEFFFRGYLLFGLERYMGSLAVWVSMLPYCMVHLHKPPLEAFASIVAGVVLGYVALRTRSILGGVLVHVGVAGGMEFLAITRIL